MGSFDALLRLSWARRVEYRWRRLDRNPVVRWLKADERTARLLVSMMTTMDDSRKVQHCYEPGGSVHVTNSVADVEFIEAIQQLFLSITELPCEDERG